MQNCFFRYKITFVLLFLIYSAKGLLFAQHPGPAYRNYNTDNGLPSTETYSVFEDSKGYIWIASDRGISRFDGYKFQNFTTKDGLPDNTIFDFQEDSQQRIWLKTFNGKMAYFDINTETFHILTKFRFNDRILQFHIDKNDRFHLVVDGITYHFDLTESFDSTNLETYPLPYFPHLVSAPYDPEQIKLVVKYVDDFKGNHNEYYNGKITVPSGTYYVYSNATLIMLLDSNRRPIAHSRQSFIQSQVIISDETIALHVQSKEAYYLSIPSLKLVRVDSTEKTITTLIIDQQGNRWESSLENGIYFYPNPSCIIYYPNKIIDKIGCRDKDVYFSDFNRFIYKNYKPTEMRSQSRVRDFLEADGQLYISDKNIFKNEQDIELDPVYYAQAIWVQDDSIWTASSTKFAKGIIQNGKYQFLTEYPQIKYRPEYIIKSGDTIWIATINGLAYLNIPLEEIHYYEDSSKTDSLLQTRITNMDISVNKNRLFLATRGAGLLIKSGNKIDQIDVNNGILSNLTNVIVNDGDSVLWLGTNLGLSKISIQSFDPLTYKIVNYTIAEGLSSNNINDICLNNDSIHLATKKGVNVFPLNMKCSNKPPSIYLTNVRINRSDSLIKPSYFLAAKENTVRFDFLALNYANPEQTSYKYRLIGADSSWYEQKATYVQFLTLPSNDYTFELVAVNHNGIESNPVKVHFTIATPLLIRWYFILIYVLTTLIIIYFISRYRLNLVRKKEQEKRQMVEMELKALRSQMNPHFTFNTLNSIQSYILKQNPEEAADYVARFAELMRLILENSSEEYIQLDREITALDRYLLIEQLRFDHKFEYHFHVDEDLDTYYEKVPSMVLQPYIENAIWHGLLHKETPGTIDIYISRNNQNLVLTIEDNGIGRKKAMEIKSKSAKQQKSFGMLITGERLQILNQSGNRKMEVNITDKYDDDGNAMGTKVILTIPDAN